MLSDLLGSCIVGDLSCGLGALNICVILHLSELEHFSKPILPDLDNKKHLTSIYSYCLDPLWGYAWADAG